MDIEIRKHAGDRDMYELWQVVNDKPKYLMAVVHTDVLEEDVHPACYDETILRAKLVADLQEED